MVEINIEKLLKEKNKTKYDLSVELNINYHRLNKIINGETTSISKKYIEKICNFFDCDVGDLMTIKKDKDDKTK